MNIQPAAETNQPNLTNTESGQALVEYVLLLIAVIGLSFAMISGITSALDKKVLADGGAMEKILRTGRIPLSSYSN